MSAPTRTAMDACGRVIASVVALLLCIGPAPALAAPPDARAAIDALEVSIAATRAGDHATARTALAGVQAVVAAQSQAIGTFEAQAQTALEQCTSAVGDLDRKIGAIKTTEQRVAQALSATENALNSAIKDGQFSAQQIATIDQQIAALKISLQERQAKLQELATWWWVPFYGLYLGIRTLADHDVEQLESLNRTLYEQHVARERSEESLHTAQAAVERLSSQGSRLLEERKVVFFVRTFLVKRMQSLRDLTAFVSDAKAFWAELDTFVSYQVQGGVGSAKVMADWLAQRLGQPGGNALVLGMGTQQANLGVKLRELAAKLEQGDAFAALSTAECKPPRETTPAQAAACRSIVESPDYERVDLQSCSRYVNPPGCPPTIATPESRENIPTELRRLENVMRVVAMQYTLPKRTVVDRNWVGLYRCMEAGALYFGKVRSAQACEAACLGHPDCLFWTYNASNAVIADTLTECWGGTRNVFPDTDSWHGFVSGGVMCEYPRAGLPPQPCQ